MDGSGLGGWTALRLGVVPAASCLPGLGGVLCSVLPAVTDRDLS